MHRIPHHEKKSSEAEIADHPQLVIQLIGLLLIELTPTLTRTLEDFLAQESVVVVAVRNGKLRQRGTDPRQIEITLVGDALALGEALLATLPSFRHFLG